MKYCIAADGGGSKTDVVLFDETGHILDRYVGPGGNATDIGIDEAFSRFYGCLEHIKRGVKEKISSMYCGMAGVLPNGDFYSSRLSSVDWIDHIRFDDDGCNLISGAFGHADGCGMVCGTGCSLFVRIDGEPLRHIGGKGYLIDTAGSGFDLGQQAIRMALRAVDRRVEPTVLTELLSEIIGMPISDSVIPIVHKGGRPYIATFARAVFEGRKLGDRICEEIFQNGAASMADLVTAAGHCFPGEYSVAAGGGIVNHYPEYVQQIREMSPERCHLTVLDAPPVYGAAVEAMWDAETEVTAKFKTRFISDYYLFP